jgi:putative transposase
VTAEKRLAHAQRIASRRQGPRPGVAPSKRWKKANGRVQKIHADVRNARKNLIHETTTRLAKNYDVIVIEDLNIAGMGKNRFLAKHISDAAWGEFARQLEYKTKWYGSALVRVDRFYPSSKTLRIQGVCAQSL